MPTFAGDAGRAGRLPGHQQARRHGVGLGPSGCRGHAPAREDGTCFLLKGLCHEIVKFLAAIMEWGSALQAVEATLQLEKTVRVLYFPLKGLCHEMDKHLLACVDRSKQGVTKRCSLSRLADQYSALVYEPK